MVRMGRIHPGNDDGGIDEDHGLVLRNSSTPEQ
jgi:hypothetical protein